MITFNEIILEVISNLIKKLKKLKISNKKC